MCHALRSFKAVPLNGVPLNRLKAANRDIDMIGTLIIAFREVIAAGIIIGIILAVPKAIRHNGRWYEGFNPALHLCDWTPLFSDLLLQYSRSGAKSDRRSPPCS
jgi:hypothetical protein